MQQDRACFTMKYEYTPELVRRFCRVHLWYRKRQHPLLLKAPGVFLTFCLIGRILYPGGGETGGLTLIDGDEATGRIMGVYVSDDHTPVMLPVFAYGPGSDRFRGTYRNTEIPRRIKSLVK